MGEANIFWKLNAGNSIKIEPFFLFISVLKVYYDYRQMMQKLKSLQNIAEHCLF